MGQERGDVVGVGEPGVLGFAQCGIVTSFGRLHQVCGLGDVGAQEGRQLIASGRAVEGLHRVSDVVLVAQQPIGRRLGVGQTGQCLDDVESRPGNVLFPQFAHRLIQCYGCLGLLGGVWLGCGLGVRGSLAACGHYAY